MLPKVTLQWAITEEPRKVKKAKTVHHLSRTGYGQVVADVVVTLQAEGQSYPKY